MHNPNDNGIKFEVNQPEEKWKIDKCVQIKEYVHENPNGSKKKSEGKF